MKNGYSLVETLVAVSVLMIALIGPITISAKSLQSSYYAREQVTAQFLAQEGIELLKAVRNDAYIKSIADLDVTSAWDWTTSSQLSDCFTSDGCNISLNNRTVGSPILGLLNVVDCSNLENCRLYFNADSERARYSVVSGEVSPFVRTITLSHDGTGDGVIVTSKVTWDSRLFKTNQTVELTGAVYRIYK